MTEDTCPIELDLLPEIDENIIFKPYFIPETESFITKMDFTRDEIFNNIDSFFNILNEKMNSWEKNFFITPGENQSFTFCPGPNIDYILFSNGLNNINRKQLDLYTLQWMFSVAMGIHILHSKNIDYNGLTDQSVFIDARLNARLMNFGNDLNNSSTKLSRRLSFYSPEQTRNQPLNPQQKKMADVYTYGIFSHEILTRLKHYDTYFNSLTKEDQNKKLEEGAIVYMDFDNRGDIPFRDLLIKCLQKEPSERCSIEEVIKYLLQLEHTKSSGYTSNIQYFNINNVDMDKYHQFIIDMLGFNKTTSYETVKENIFDITNQEKVTQKCTFDDLKEGYNNGITYCRYIIEQFLQKLNEELQNKYNEYIFNNSQINQFDIMKAFIKYQNNSKELDLTLDNLRRENDNNEASNDLSLEIIRNIDAKLAFEVLYNIKTDEFFTKIEFTENFNSEYIINFFKAVEQMDRWKKNFFIIPSDLYLYQSFAFCPGSNIDSFLFSKELNIEKKKLDLYILQWIFSIAMGIYIIHSQDIDYFGLSDKSVFIDSDMNARMIIMTYPFDRQTTTIPYQCYFYSPEQFNSYFNSQSADVKDYDKKKSDIYMFGTLAYELLTRDKLAPIFETKSINDLTNILNSGITKLLKFENHPDIPLHNLLENCLNTEPEKRPKIQYIIECLLKLKELNSTSPSNQNYVNLNDIDYDEYHRFITKSIGFDPKIDYKSVKNLIFQMISGKLTFRSFMESKNKCTFTELKNADALGIKYCNHIFDLMLEKYISKDKEKLLKLINENPQISKYDIMEIFVKYKDDNKKLDQELNYFLTKKKGKDHFVSYLYNMDNDHNVFKKFREPEYIKLPYNLNYEFHQNLKKNSDIVQPLLPHEDRIQIYEHLNLFNFYEANYMKTSISVIKKLQWLKSVAEGLNEVHKNGFFIPYFTCKNVYIDDSLKASLFVPKAIKKVQSNDFNKLLGNYLLKDEEEEDINDVSFFFRPPELYRNNIQEFDFDRAGSYSFGVLAKELIEANSPLLLTNTLSNSEKMHILRNPHWNPFSKSYFKFSNKKEEYSNNINFLIEILNKCLSIRPNRRATIKEICECFQKLDLTAQSKDKQISTQEYKRHFCKKSLSNNIVTNINSYYSIDNEFISKNHADIDARSERARCKLIKSNLTIGRISPKTTNQFILRQIMNNENNLELSFMLNNNFGCPNEKDLSMKSIEEAVNELKNAGFFNSSIRKNKRGDIVIDINNQPK